MSKVPEQFETSLDEIVSALYPFPVGTKNSILFTSVGQMYTFIEIYKNIFVNYVCVLYF